MVDQLEQFWSLFTAWSTHVFESLKMHYLITWPSAIESAMDGLGVGGLVSGQVVLSSFVWAVCFLVLFFLFAARRRNIDRSQDLRYLTRGPRCIGYLAVSALFLGLVGWAVAIPIASATIAHGVISPDGSRKSVEHLEGGIIHTVHVTEGDIVEAGQPLFTLEDVQAKSMFLAMRERYLFLVANEARLIAERSEDPDVGIEFPAELLHAEDIDIAPILDAQVRLLSKRRQTLEGRESILKQRIQQMMEQNAGLGEAIEAQDEQLALLTEEVKRSETLFKDGLTRHSQMAVLKRAKAEVVADRAINKARISENNERIGETRIQLLSLHEERAERALDELAELRRQIGEIRRQMPMREDVLQRTIVRAPFSGTVLNLSAISESAVIRPGETLLEIVPLEARLIIDARVRPSDIERVSPGMSARVLLTAYSQRNLPLIYGTLRSISADRLIEDRTGEPYFLAKVEVDADRLSEIRDIQLVPGMPADIMILDGQKTLANYLLEPLLNSMDRSFREG